MTIPTLNTNSYRSGSLQGPQAYAEAIERITKESQAISAIRKDLKAKNEEFLAKLPPEQRQKVRAEDMKVIEEMQAFGAQLFLKSINPKRG